MKTNNLLGIFICLLFSCLTPYLFAESLTSESNLDERKLGPKIAIIIDDLGHKKTAGEQVINLDIPLAVAVLPDTQHGKHLAEYAQKNDVEVMLHLPMQPSFNEKLMTRNTLSINMNEDQFKRVVTTALNQIPHIKGVNNHMGSLFTQLPAQMGWLMESIRAHPESLFFVDSFTSERSIAYEIAQNYAIPNTKRNVFLDRELNTQHMEAQIMKLKDYADRQGEVVVIGHPFKETIALLKKHIPKLKQQGYEFVKVSSLTQTNNLSTLQDNNDFATRSSDALQTLH